MILKFIKSNNIDFHNYSIFLNNKKVDFNNSIKLNLTDNRNVFFVKTFWFKTKEYDIEANHNQCVIKIENLLSKKNYLIIMIIFSLLITLSLIINSQLIWNITAGYSLICLLSQLYLYSFGRNHYIKVIIEYFE